MERPRETESPTARTLLEATEACLRRDGLAGLSMRNVAEQAHMPLSQIHYHFGSKQGLLLALLDFQNRRLLARQQSMYAQPMPLWQRWMQACDYLEEDVASGYVRVLQEMIAAGWSDPHIATEARRILQGWYGLIVDVAQEAARRLGGLGPFTAREVATLVAHGFIGAESMILLGIGEDQMPTQSALRKVGGLIRAAETQAGGERHARKTARS
jgi:AcrR family transcriptional regulator